jgi:hypothetical protein
MRKYTVTAVLAFPAGVVLGLNDDQAGRRKHALKPLGKGVYETTAPVQFKVGETISTDAEVNKVLATFIEPEEATRSKAREKAKAEAAAKDLAELTAKAKAWDELQPELEQLRAKAAMFDSCPQDIRDSAIFQAAESAKAAKK